MKTDYKQLCLSNDSKQVIDGEGGNVILPPKEKPL